MAQNGRYHGGLVFLGDAESALTRCERIVRETLEDYGHTVEHVLPVSGGTAEVHTHSYSVELRLTGAGSPELSSPPADARRPARPVPLKLEIALAPSFAEVADAETSELLLAVALFRLVSGVSADEIEWLDHQTKLSKQQFLSAFSGVMPAPSPIRPERRFAPVEETAEGISRHYDAIMGRPPRPGSTGLVQMSEEEQLALAFREAPHPDELDGHDLDGSEPSSQLRLASWAMTGVVASVSMPVAASMAAINLLKGEDFRLNTQVLSFSAFVAFVHGSSAATAMTLF